jgi:hypothetical protein
VTTLVLNLNQRNTVALAAYRQRGSNIRESIVADLGGGLRDG